VPYLSVVNKDGGYALQASGCNPGTHCSNRTVVKEFDPPKQAWGGSVYVNLGDLEAPEGDFEIAFLGGYAHPASTERNFVIGTLLNPSHPPEWSSLAPPGCYIYLKAFHNSNRITGLLLEEVGEKMFFISGCDLENLDSKFWPDRFVKIEWFITPNKKLFARVDGSEWKETMTGNNTGISFHRVDAGWVSSYMGGNVKYKDLVYYDESCIPKWMNEN